MRRLSLLVARRLDGLLHGEHLGVLPGPGSEPAEARAYAPGDDVRRIDWAVTARTGETTVRTTVAERELETTVVLDLSGSMAFGTVSSEKRDLALGACAAFLHLSRGAGDRAAVLAATPDGIVALPARSGRDALRAALHVLTRIPRADGAGPGLAAALRRVLVPPRRRGLVVVVTDLLGPDDWAAPLRQVAARHDVVVVEVLDPRELVLPDAGALRLVDPETGRAVDVTLTRTVRERYALEAARRREERVAALRSAGVTHLSLRTDRDWLIDLAAGLALRRRTRAVRA